MNIKTALFSAAACLVAATFAVQIDRPWARYAAESSPVTGSDGHSGSSTFTLSDLSGGGNDASIGGYSFRTNESIRGNAIFTTGWSYAYMYGPDPGTVSRTYSAWVKRDKRDSVSSKYMALEGDHPLYLLGRFAGLDIRTAYTGNTWQVYCSDSRVQELSVVYARLRWQHIALTVADSGARDGLGRALCTVALYADGALVASVDNLAVPVVNPYSSICLMGIHDADPLFHSFPAWQDEIRIYSEALSAAEVNALYKATRVRKLMARFPMDVIDSDGGGGYSTPNVVNPSSPMYLGSEVFSTNGLEGAGAIFFPGPAEQPSGPFNSYGVYTNTTGELVEDVLVSFWMKRSQGQCPTNSMMLLNWAYRLKDANDTAYPLPMYVDQRNNSLITASVLGGTISNAMRRNEEWAHFTAAVSFTYNEEPPTEYDSISRQTKVASTRLRIWRNGALISDRTDSAAGNQKRYLSRPNAFLLLANYFRQNKNDNAPHMRSPARLAIDDVRVYFGQIDDDFVQEVYRGTSSVRAGEDFAVSGPTAVLNGMVGEVSSDRLSPGYGGECAWSLLSAPPGGEGAAIESPGAVSTRVTLPVEGEYRFKLSNVSVGVAEEDVVTVTRDDSLAATGLSALLSVKSATGMCAVVQAEGVAAGTRVRWLQKSGPGGAFFKDASATNTLVTFTAPGSYALVCETSDGTGTARHELAVTAQGTSLECQMTNSLTAWWDCDCNSSYARIDKVAGYALMADRMSSTTSGGYFVPGVGGSYASYNGDGTAIDPNRGTSFYETDFAYHLGTWDASTKTLTPPLSEWITVSMWMYHDSADPSPVPCYSATLAYVFICQGVFYLPKYGTSTDFEVRCVGTDKNFHASYFKGPDINLTNRWTHVVALINQRGTRPGEPVEVWVDGHKLERLEQPQGMGEFTCPRLMEYTLHSTYTSWAFGGFSRQTGSIDYSFMGGPSADVCRFPGAFDEIRIYNRHLEESEIRCLYEYPCGPCPEIAPSVTVPLDDVKITCRKEGTVAASAFAASAGASLSCKWSVVYGDASKVQISDDTSLTPTIRFTKAGEYRLQLAVGDGLRTAYSEPVSFMVQPKGLMVRIR